MRYALAALIALALLVAVLPAPVATSPLDSPLVYLPLVLQRHGGPRYGCSYGCPPDAPGGYDCQEEIAALCGDISIGTALPGNHATAWPLSTTMWAHIPERWMLDGEGEWLMNTPSNRPDMLASVLEYIAIRPGTPFLLGLEPNGQPNPASGPVLPERYGEFVRAWLPHLDGMKVGLAGMGQTVWDTPAADYLAAAFPDGVDVDYVDLHLYDLPSADASLAAVSAWRDADAPGAELICTEFGALPSVEDPVAQMAAFDALMDKYGVTFRAWYAFYHNDVVWPDSFLVQADGTPNEPLHAAFDGLY